MSAGHEPSDAEVDAFVEAHPSGATADEIAEVLGVTRQRVFQLLDNALRKVMRELRWYQIHRTDDVIPFG
jgi:DNA-directed RNA polymerase sigma subunit (sigma70/sigma32)